MYGDISILMIKFHVDKMTCNRLPPKVRSLENVFLNI